MVKHEFRQAQAEHCLFVRPDVRATTYVDDMLLALRTEQAGETLKAQLSESFRVTATPLMQYLNISIVMKGGRVYASQRKYVERLLADTGMDTANGCQTPAATTRLEDIDELLPRVRQVPGAILDRCAEVLQDGCPEIPQHNGAQDKHRGNAQHDHVREDH